MQISIHLGAHCTDDDQLVRSLLKNKGRFAEKGIVVPGPSRYRDVLRDVLGRLHGQAASDEAQEVVLEALMDEDEAERVILSNHNFLCTGGQVFSGGQFYANAGTTAHWLRNVFPDHEVGFFLGIRNPATYIPTLFSRNSRGNVSYGDFMQGVMPGAVNWSDVIAEIRAANPDCPITVWCNEDTPFVWKQVIQEIAGLDTDEGIKGGDDILSSIMPDQGYEHMATYIQVHTPQDEAERRRIVATFLEKYAITEELEDEIDLPGWTSELVDQLCEAYDEDVEMLAHIPGVTYIPA